MDLERLNKTQIILLVLFVSFVTSIATGIVTVTLMDQAPPAITQTINRVVEHTVEKVVPEKTQGAATVKTVIVKEESLVVGIVEKNSMNIVEIFLLKNLPVSESVGQKGDLITGEFAAIGFVVSREGIVIADSALIGNDILYAVKTSDEKIHKASVLMQDEEKGIALLSIIAKEGDKIEFSSPEIADSEKIKLGESVLSLGRKKDISVSVGIVSKLQSGQRIIAEDTKGTQRAAEGTMKGDLASAELKKETYLVSIYTTINTPQSGAILLNMEGNIIGMNILRDGVSFAVPSNTIKGMISSLQNDAKNKPSSPEVQG